MRLIKALLTVCLMLAVFSACLPESSVTSCKAEADPAVLEANRDRIYEFLRDELELNFAAACGIMANIHMESGFDPEALGDNGTSFGICQWHNRRYDQLINWSAERDLDYKELETQLLYMQYELDNYFDFVYERMLYHIPNTMRGAYSAGNYWCIYYERPLNKHKKGDVRGELARTKYWTELK